jgi:ribose-phosphate pyrophosphokinase
MIVGGTCLNSARIAEEISSILGVPFVKVESRKFPDGELYVRAPTNLKGEHIIYVQTTAPDPAKGYSQSDSLMELFLTLDYISSQAVEAVDLVVPYFAHARQDKEFKKGEVVSAKTVSRVLKSLGVSRIYTVDVHFRREIGPYELLDTGIPAYNISATEALATYVRDAMQFPSPVAIIPDKGHEPIKNVIERVLGCEVVLLDKRRESGWESPTFVEKHINVEGKNVVIFDDVISAGKSMEETVKFVKERRPKEIIVAITHALYLGDARERILKSGASRIIATDVIPQVDSVVRIAPILADALRGHS